jgi:uncharacterized protein YpmB
MKKFFIILLILIVAIFAVWKFVFQKDKKPSGPKPVGLLVSKHSDEFNMAMTKMIDTYYGLTEAFVNWDTVSINDQTDQLKISVDSLKLKEMEKDSAIYFLNGI